MKYFKFITFIIAIFILLSALSNWYAIYLDDYYLDRDTERTDAFVLARNIQGNKFGHDVLLYYQADSLMFFSEFKVQVEDLSRFFIRRRIEIEYSIERPSAYRMIWFSDKNANMSDSLYNEIMAVYQK